MLLAKDFCSNNSAGSIRQFKYGPSTRAAIRSSRLYAYIRRWATIMFPPISLCMGISDASWKVKRCVNLVPPSFACTSGDCDPQTLNPLLNYAQIQIFNSGHNSKSSFSIHQLCSIPGNLEIVVRSFLLMSAIPYVVCSQKFVFWLTSGQSFSWILFVIDLQRDTVGR